MEFAKKEGVVVSYHVFAVNAARNGEPDLILAVEYKDYMPVAQQLAMEKKLNAAMATDNHKAEAASGQRTPMRKFMGGAELQELNFK